jgi:hypothetical protein
MSRGPNSYIPHIIIFDNEQNLLNIQINTHGVLYPEEITPDNLRKKYEDDLKRAGEQ